jgi:hypothetical protein
MGRLSGCCCRSRPFLLFGFLLGRAFRLVAVPALNPSHARTAALHFARPLRKQAAPELRRLFFKYQPHCGDVASGIERR